MPGKAKVLWGSVLSLMLIGSVNCAFSGVLDVPERRKDQFGRDFGYYIYPIGGKLPGLGTASGGGASVLNMGGGDTDLTVFDINGAFHAAGLALTDYHILQQRLLLDAGYNDYNVYPMTYNRGMTSSATDVIYPNAVGHYLLGQMTLTFAERRFELFVRGMNGQQQVLSVMDQNGQLFSGVDTSWKANTQTTVGGSLDLTDDRLDPRAGVRLEFARHQPTDYGGADFSQYFVDDYNLTGFIPIRKGRDTLALNLFYSAAHITNMGLTDPLLLQQRYGLNCTQYPVGPAQTACQAAEAKSLASMLANNQYGTATSIGGTQRLRSFNGGRFYAGQALSYGAEYRMNLTDERTPFDFIIARGVRTGIQLAAFAEGGAAADQTSDLFINNVYSYGVGVRLILSGIVIRFDLATGNEGSQSQLFITYPWSMFSVDKPN